MSRARAIGHRDAMHRALAIVLCVAGCARESTGSPDGVTTTSSPTTDASSTEAPASTGDDPGTSSRAAGSDEDTTGVPDSTTGSPVANGLAFEPIPVDEPLVRATDLDFIPGRAEFLLSSKDGDVGHYRLTNTGAQLLGRFVVPDAYTPSDCGLISLAVDPGFAEKPLIFVGQCISQHESAIYRFELLADYDATADTRAEILVVGHPSANNPWHNVGSIGFDPDGRLWALFGDKTVSSSGQDRTNNLGALVRIVPDRRPGGSGYTAALDNPYYGDPTYSWDIYAYGLRSPWKGVLDPHGRWWIGDVGSDDFEEIDLVTAPAQNFGWPVHEGACVRGDCRGYVDPAAVWPHAPHPYIEDDEDATAANARVAWVGLAYEDRGNDRYEGLLTGKVLFGDSCIGYVRALTADADGTIVADEHLGHLVSPTAWAQAPDGYVYVVTYGGCGSGSIDNDDPPPAKIHRAVLSYR